MEERIRALEAKLAEMSQALIGLEGRLDSLEASRARGATAPVRKSTMGEELDSDVPAMPRIDFSLSDLGRAFLVMAGGFALRAMTDLAVLPQAAGIALGLFYALLWLWLADRAGLAGKTVRAITNGSLAAILALPLIWEATTKFGVIAPPLAALLLTVLLAVALGVAWRHELRFLAWLFALGAAASSTALPFMTGAIEPFVLVLLICGLASVWLAYGKKWLALRWPIAVLVDFMVVFMVSVAAASPGPDERYGSLSVPLAQVIAVALLLSYAGSFAMRTLWRRRDVTVFEVLQSAAALAVGFGGAARLARVTGQGGTLLGMAALVGAALCYLVAFAFVDRRIGRGRNFVFYSSLGLVLLFTGSALLSDGDTLAVTWCLLALAAAYLGGKHDRITLRTHAALYTLAAAWQAGLLGLGWTSFFSASQPISWDGIRTPVLMLVGSVLAYAILVITQRGTDSAGLARLPRLAVATVALIGVAGLLTGYAILATAADSAGSILSPVALRVLVLSLAAIALALAARRPQFPELGWLVYPILALGGALLVFGGLRQANALTLTVSFIAYGGALILAPQLLRVAGKERDSGYSPE